MTAASVVSAGPAARVATAGFANDLLQGLRARPRAVPPKYFYDARGSALFDAICELQEYYPTRTEMRILSEHANEMADCVGPQAEIVEFGAGASRKVRLLLEALEEPRGLLPVDISGEHLHEAVQSLRQEFPRLQVQPVVGDFTRDLALPPAAGPRVGFFPGSSIGNFEPQEAARLLRRMAAWLDGGGLLIGVDLIKDPAELHAAYNDRQGVTAAFNLNLLARANRELEADFDLAGFAHYAFYNPLQQRIEMHLVSRKRQSVRVCGEVFGFAPGDTVHTESSYKYSVDGFGQLARTAGLQVRRVWTDAAQRFAVFWLGAG
jgi:dimethylhistidine N-methyltransferase